MDPPAQAIPRAILTAECKAAVLNSGWLSEKPPQFQSSVLAEARIRHYAPGEYTHHIGDDLGGIYGIVRGSFAGLGQVAGSGIAMGSIFRRGDWVGEGPMVCQLPRTLAFRAMEDSLVLYVSLAAVSRISECQPEAARHFFSLAEYNLNLAVRCMADLLIRRADRRIAAVLLRVTGASASAMPEPCQLTQTDLAEMANASRHIVNATLKNFETMGWLEIGYGKITVLDAAAIQAYADKPD